ncbi:MAG: hypothetical protein NVSMB32_05300 [Actinomycetota bacterium]
MGGTALALTPEVEAFVRYLAMNPHKLELYARDPEDFLVATNVGGEASATIREMGVEGVRQVVKTVAEAIYADPEAGVLRRDETVRGFGARPPSKE